MYARISRAKIKPGMKAEIAAKCWRGQSSQCFKIAKPVGSMLKPTHDDGLTPNICLSRLEILARARSSISFEVGELLVKGP